MVVRGSGQQTHPYFAGPLPSPSDSGAVIEMCLVYLAPGVARIEDMVFEPTEGYDPITWTGEVQTPAQKDTSRPGRKKRAKR